MKDFKYIGACTGFSGVFVQAAVDAARPITRRTFLTRVDLDSLPRGHELRGFKGSREGYFLERLFRSKLADGRRCYILEWSGFEHFFAELPARRPWAGG